MLHVVECLQLLSWQLEKLRRRYPAHVPVICDALQQ